MNPNKEHTNFELLVARYLSREASQEEVEMLETIVKSDEKKRKLFYQYKQSWRLSEFAVAEADTSKAWSFVEKRLSDPEIQNIKSLNPINKFKILLRVAAVALILAGGIYTIFHLTKTKEKILVAFNDLETVILDDGTEITLNRNSSIHYQAKFKDAERRIKLIGDAYFQVAQNPDKPFIVETQHLDVVVLGTTFYVNAQQDAPFVEVIVTTGKVAMVAPENPTIELTASKRGVYDVEKGLLADDEDIDRNFLSWKTRKLEFDDTDLGQVATTLEKTYSTPIILADRALDSCRLTATFNDLSLDDVITIIAETFDLETRRSNGRIELSGIPCE
jgi:transmembrane sensor